MNKLERGGGNTVVDHTELNTWKLGLQLVDAIYELCENLPESERYGLMSQLKKAATSVPAQIAEGAGRDSTKEYIRFLIIGRASLKELHTHLVICYRRGFIGDNELRKTKILYKRLSAGLSNQIQSLREKRTTN